MKMALLRNTILLALLAWLLADWHLWHGPCRRWVESRLERKDEKEERPFIARVGDQRVTPEELSEAMRDHLWRTGRSWNDLSPQEEVDCRAEVLQQLVDGRLVRLARSRNRGMSNAAVDRELDHLQRQFDLDGDFEPRLAMRRLSEAELRASVGDAIGDQDWLESQFAEKMRPVTESEVADWVRQHSHALSVPPVFGVAHIYLTTHDAKKPDREADIREIHRRLKAGEATFEELAAQFSDDDRTKKSGGYLGWVARSRMPEDFMSVVEKMTKGETTEPVRTKLGWHIIRLVDQKPAREASIEEVKNEVSAMLANERRDAAVKAVMDGLRAQFKSAVLIDSARLEGVEPTEGP